MAEAASDAGTSQPKSTPRAVKGEGGTTPLSKLRREIAPEMADEILQSPVDVFLAHYAPFRPSDKFVAQALADLKAKSRVNEVVNGNKTVQTLADFKTPYHKKETEATIFKRLEPIMDILQNVEVTDGRERSFSYKDCGAKNIASEIEGTDFRFDACITSSPDITPIVLSDAAVFAEFKKANKDEDTEDNRWKLVSAAVQIMNDDPRRKWVYGITIEYNEMAVWYFCRSHSVKSVAFDFTTNIDTLIRVLLSLLYATESEVGYDTTVTRIRHEKKLQYVYELGTREAPRFYRTLELIFAARVLSTTGRKTRIWKVVEVVGREPGQFEVEKSGAVPVVLKDGWLDEGSRSEKEIQARIFESLDRLDPSDYKWAINIPVLGKHLVTAFEKHQYKEYFMEILDSRLLAKTKPRHDLARADSTLLSVIKPKPINSVHSLSGTSQGGDHSRTPVGTPSRPGETEDLRPREYKTKQQHRLIYRDVGCDLHHSKDLASSFTAIHDTFIALVLLYLAGWTHRDISTGNIIIVKTPKRSRGKLSDLEYAKEFTDESSSVDPKTGTPYFMPLEIHRGKPLYNPEQGYSSTTPVDIFVDQAFQFSGPERKNDHGTHPMKFRFQHDLESLWWVALWVLLYRVGGDKARALALKIFTGSHTPSDARDKFFTSKDNNLSDHIHEQLEFLAPVVLNIRAVLHDSYVSKTKTEGLMDRIQYRDIYKEVWGSLTRLVLGARSLNICFEDSTRNDKKRTYSEAEPGNENVPPFQLDRKKTKPNA